MHPRFSLIHPFVPALWLGLAAIVSGKDILTHTEPTGAMIEIFCPFEEVPDWGFLPVEIKASTTRERAADWHISVSSRDYYSGTNMRSGLNFRGRGDDVTRGSALIPMGNVGRQDSYSGYVGIEAALAGGGAGNSNLNSGGYSSSSSPRVVKTTLLSEGARATLSTQGIGFSQGQAPGDWRAYCGFHDLHITALEWESMTPAARTAIRHWLRLGGRLNVLRAPAGKSLSDIGVPVSDAGQETGAVSRGIVSKDATLSVDSENATSAANDWVMRATSGDAVRDWERRDAGSFAMPSATLAAGFMLVVVVGFAVLAGPLNVFVFAAARRRHRLFVTTPLISLVAGGLLVVSVILSDGIGGKGVRYAWLESAPVGENTNYLVQHQHSRCGAMFSTGFEIPEDAFFAPMMLESGEISGNLSVELEAGKVRAAGPWFSSRRAQNLYLAAARPGRGRIEQSGTPERPALTSAFDFPIGRIFWLAPDGKTWWQAGALAQGTSTALQPCTAAEVQQALDDATAHAPPEYGRDLTTASRRPGYFVALAERIPAIETHKSIRWQTHGFVTGPVLAAQAGNAK